MKIYSCFHCSAVFYTLNRTHITLLNHKFSWLTNFAGVVLNAQLHWLIICMIFSILVGDLETAHVGSKSPA